MVNIIDTEFLTAARLLRSSKTHLYFTGSDWTHDPCQAQIFPDEVEATRACIINDLHDGRRAPSSTRQGC